MVWRPSTWEDSILTGHEGCRLLRIPANSYTQSGVFVHPVRGGPGVVGDGAPRPLKITSSSMVYGESGTWYRRHVASRRGVVTVVPVPPTAPSWGVHRGRLTSRARADQHEARWRNRSCGSRRGRCRGVGATAIGSVGPERRDDHGVAATSVMRSERWPAGGGRRG